jgi:putative DNA-invertase from lambdoid prophage Rac
MKPPRPAPESTLSPAIAASDGGRVVRVPARRSWRKSGSTIRAVAYMRVSKGEQSPENQRADVERIARARGLELVGEYVETVSGAARERPQFDAMIEGARAGAFDVLLVWALDRFGRSMVKNINAVVELDRLGVQVVSVREPWLDTGGPVRALLVAIFSWVAEQERARLGERTRAGLERARSKGKRLGRPRRHISAAELARVKTLRARGVSVRETARQLNIAGSTLRRALKEYT